MNDPAAAPSGSDAPRADPRGDDGGVPPIASLELLEAAAAASHATPVGAWWTSLQATEHVFAAPTQRDPRTGEPVAQSLRDFLLALDVELAGAQQPLPVDMLFQTIELAGGPLAHIVERHRTRIVRGHERIALHRVREMDAKSVSWIARQPGRTVREKLAGQKTVLGVVRRFTADTPENRVAIALASRLAPRVGARIAAARDDRLYDARAIDLARLAVLEDVYAACTERLRRSDLADVPSATLVRANNALLADPMYSRVWRAYRRLRAYEEKLAAAWPSLPGRIGGALLSCLAARLTGAGIVRPIDTVIRSSPGDGARVCGLEPLLPGGPEALAASTPWAFVLQVASPSTAEARAIRLRLAGDGIDAELVRFEGNGLLKAAPTIPVRYVITKSSDRLEPRRGLSLNVATQARGGGRTWAGRADVAGFAELADRIAADLRERTRARVPPPHARGSDACTAAEPRRIGLDLAGPPVRIAGAGEIKEASTATWVGNIMLGADHSEWLQGDSQRTVPLATEQLALHSLTAVLAPDADDDQGLQRRVAHEICHRLATELGVAPDDRLAYGLPDGASDAAQETLRATMRSAFSHALPVWRSVAAAIGWQTSSGAGAPSFADADVRPGDTTIVLDAESPVLGRALLVARHDGRLATELPATRGLFWERRPPPPPGERDELLGGDAVLRQYARALLDDVLPRRKSRDEERRTALADALTRTGIMQRVLSPGMPPRVPLDAEGTRLLELRHDPDTWGLVLAAWERGIVQAVPELVDLAREVSPHGRVHLVLAGRPFIDAAAGIRRAVDGMKRSRPDRVVVLGPTAVAAGATACLDRLAAGLITWSEWLPDLHLEVIRDGLFGEVPLMSERRIDNPLLGEENETAVSTPLVLDAGHPWFDFPIVSGRTTRVPLASEARLLDRNFPLAAPVEVKLSVRYRYGLDRSYELWFSPADPTSAPLRRQAASWREPAPSDKRSPSATAVPTFAAGYRAQVTTPELVDAQRRAIDQIGIASPRGSSTPGTPDPHRDAVRALGDLIGDGRGELAEGLDYLLQLLRDVTVTRFDARVASYTTRALTAALWRHPDLVQTIADLGPDKIVWLTHVARRTLANLLNRVPRAIVDRWERERLRKVYGNPFLTACELLLALLRVRDRPGLGLLQAGSLLAEQMARSARLLDGMFTRAGVPLRSGIPVVSGGQPPSDLRLVSSNVWLLNVLLTGDAEVHLLHVQPRPRITWIHSPRRGGPRLP